MNRDRHYATMADKLEGRDHDVAVAYKDRLTVSEGAFGRAWVKFNPGVQLVYVDDAEGRPRALTPKQYAVLTAALDMIDGVGITMRDLARKLEVAPSTVSRAMTKLAAWGLIAYFCGRGRLSGLVIFRRAKGDQWEWVRDRAKARVRRWSEASRERVSRLWANVAPYIHRGEEGVSGTNIRDMYYYSHKGATLTAQPFTVQELRDAGII